MSVFARIVVGVDGTDWGFEALRQALVLAPKENAIVRAVTALDTTPAVHAGLHAGHFATLLTNEAEAARATAETIIAGREGFEARIVRGKPVDVLRRERDELQATLMALGGRRSSRFLGIMLGDTGTQLIHDAACSSLLAYLPDRSPWQPNKIVVGLDGSTYAHAALVAAEELACIFGGAVEVVAATGGTPVERGSAWTDRVDTWDPADAVTALVECSRTVDLVVVGSRGVHGLRSLGSVAERIAHQAHCTALVVHESQAIGSADHPKVAPVS